MKETFENASQPPQVLLNSLFSNLESVACALDWIQDFRRLEPGQLEASLLVVGNDNCQATRVSFNRSFHQRGKPPSHMLAFGLPDNDQGRLKWEGVDVPAGALVNFNGPGGLDMTSTGPFRGTILAFDAERFARHVEQFEPDSGILRDIERETYWTPRADQLTDLNGLVLSVFAAANEDAADEALLEYRDSFDFELTGGIIRVIDGAHPSEPAPLPTRRRVLKRALEFLDSSGDQAVTVATLCRAVATSCSTLERAFMDEFGVTPKAYMRARRLTEVRKKLVRPDRSDSITEIARSWGFWHMSAFAADYRNQFGELPSETRSRISHQ